MGSSTVLPLRAHAQQGVKSNRFVRSAVAVVVDLEFCEL